MNAFQKTSSLLIVIILMIASVGVVYAAQPGAAAPCGGTGVSGTVVAVDEATGEVTVDTGGGALCTVTISNGTSNHPIVKLLGQYFGDISVSNFTEDVTALQGWAVQQEDGTWAWADATTTGSQQIRVISDNGDGTFTAQILDETGAVIETIIINVTDPALAESLNQALEALAVDLTLDGSGKLLQVSDQIAAYHSQGMGFGVLVKLYSIAKASGGQVTVEQLVSDFQAGTGIGELFKTYGKPPHTGVGHVRQELKGQTAVAKEKGKPDKGKPDKGNKNK